MPASGASWPETARQPIARQSLGRAEVDAARRRAGLTLPDGLPSARPGSAGCFRNGRWLKLRRAGCCLGCAVAYGFGIVVYFTADREPACVGGRGAGACRYRRRVMLTRAARVGFAAGLGFAGIAAGFATATLKTARIAHPVLAFRRPRTIAGFVETPRGTRAQRPHRACASQHIEGARLDAVPERVRLSVRKGTAPAVGSFVAFKAHLDAAARSRSAGRLRFRPRHVFPAASAPPATRSGKIKTVPPPVAPGLWLRYAALRRRHPRGDRPAHPRGPAGRPRLDRLGADHRQARRHFRSGERCHSTSPSLAHVLSISGYHMAVVAGIVFFFIRAGLALIPSLAAVPDQEMGGARRARRPARSIWCCPAPGLDAALLHHDRHRADRRHDRPAGADLPHHRHRRLRRAVVRAGGDRASELPDVVCRNAGVDRRPTNSACRGAPAPTPRAQRALALWGGHEIFALVMASLVAGLATTPYAAFHFHRLAPYGVLANLLAMPVISAWVMPMGILGVLAMPFGFDAAFWQADGRRHRLDDHRGRCGSRICPAPSATSTPSAPGRCCWQPPGSCCCACCVAAALERGGAGGGERVGGDAACPI